MLQHFNLWIHLLILLSITLPISHVRGFVSIRTQFVYTSAYVVCILSVNSLRTVTNILPI